MLPTLMHGNNLSFIKLQHYFTNLYRVLHKDHEQGKQY